MKAQLGRPTGLALALLATLLATFLAMGVFPVAQAQTDPSATRSISPTEVAPGGEVSGNHHCQWCRPDDSGVLNCGNAGQRSFRYVRVSVSTDILFRFRFALFPGDEFFISTI